MTKVKLYLRCLMINFFQVKDSAGNHVGYAASCGGGIEGCDIHSGSIGQQCSTSVKIKFNQLD